MQILINAASKFPTYTKGYILFSIPVLKLLFSSSMVAA